MRLVPYKISRLVAVSAAALAALASCKASTNKSSARAGLTEQAEPSVSVPSSSTSVAQVASGETKVIADGEVTAVIRSRSGELNASIKRLADDIGGNAETAVKTFASLETVTEPKVIDIKSSGDGSRSETKLVVTPPKSEAHRPLYVAVFFPDEKPQALLVILPLSDSSVSSTSAEFKTMAQRFIVAVVANPSPDLPSDVRLSNNRADLLREATSLTSNLASLPTTTTTAPPAPPPLTIADRSPTVDSVNVPTNAAVTVLFSEKLKVETLTAGSFILQNAYTLETVSAQLSYDPAIGTATLTPTIPLLKEAAYRVTLTISVKSVSGVSLASTEAWVFQTAARQWLTTTQVQPTGSGGVSQLRLVAGPSGDAFAIWQRSGGAGVQEIKAARYTQTFGWQAPTLISSGAGICWRPDIALDKDGNALAIWAQASSPHYDLKVRRYAVGVGWEAPTVLDTEAEDFGQKVAFDSKGNAFAIWSKRIVGPIYTWAARHTAGATWSSPALLEPLTGAGLFSSTAGAIAFDGADRALAIWRANPSGSYSALSGRFDEALGWTDPVTVGADSSSVPILSMSKSGTAFAAWFSTATTPWRLKASRFLPATGWDAAHVTIDTGSVGNAESPAIAAHDNGDAMLVWQQSDGTRENTWSARYLHGTGWQPGELLESGAGAAKVPQVAADAGGNTFVVWQQHDGARENIWFRRHNYRTGWAPAELVETDDSAAATAPQVVVDRTGNVMITWQLANASGAEIWSRRLE